ncbi:hypothetical protein Scep_019726 [Stephania cephalantha]|uniref:Uncharacterized protein n=1 Tax=Stephania cephalantha TaxID=152367 RepID=A0AAP0NLN2_9MAGN
MIYKRKSDWMKLGYQSTVKKTRSARGNFMETQENVEVKCLSEEAAWELFVSKISEEVHMAEGYTSKGSSASEYCSTWDRETEINKGFHTLEELKDACLLANVKVFERQDNQYVRIHQHNLVRDSAIQIMRKDFNIISKAG